MPAQFLRYALVKCLLIFPFLAFSFNTPPTLEAQGNEMYCPGGQQPIVTYFNITDPDDTGTEALYLQISTGYINGQDRLTLINSHPTINTTWDQNEGKLTLRSNTGSEINYQDLIAAVYDVVYESSVANPSGERLFSITVGDANYLPSTDHYYEYIPQIGITWTSAKTAAEGRDYYGLQGYLATILTPEEAQLSGEQAGGAGWIGGSDADQEGTWKWVTGPEAGLTFWNGGVNGTSPNYANWNANEPNNQGDEDYAHVTAPGVGTAGSWNDLSNVGNPSGDYQPKGYIVEYGGSPGDPILQISADTRLFMPSIVQAFSAESCGSGRVDLSANTLNGSAVFWFDTPSGGSPIANGNTFTTPILTTSTTYYAVAGTASCLSGERIPVEAVINELALINANVTLTNCDEDGTPDGITSFNLNEATDLITTNSNIDFSFFTSQNDANSNQNEISAVPFINDQYNTLYVRVQEANGCFQTAVLDLQVSTTSFPTNYTYTLSSCDIDDEADGVTTFDLTQAKNDLRAQFPSGQNLSVKFYQTLADAQLEEQEITSQTAYINEVPFNETLFVRVENENSGACFGIGPHLNLVVNPRPDFKVLEKGSVCLETPLFLIETFDANGLYTYNWQNESGQTLGTSASLPVTEAGIYTVTAQAQNGCISDIKTVTITASQAPILELDNFEIKENSRSNIIEIQNVSSLGVGNYEFALDEALGPYQSEPIFNNVSPGIHTLYAVDTNGCGSAQIEIPVLGFPNYFTPNGDGTHDTWQVEGIGNRPIGYVITIYNRYGALIKILTPDQNSWDGTQEGKQVPATEYWFRAKLIDSDNSIIEQKGHFSLIRR